jgi:hypothetical protein
MALREGAIPGSDKNYSRSSDPRQRTDSFNLGPRLLPQESFQRQRSPSCQIIGIGNLKY